MAPANGPEDSGSSEDSRNKDNGDSKSNPFVSFRHSVDNLAASLFTDIAEAFPSLQKYVPPPNTSFFDEWTRDAFRRFNDSYERATNPERKRIERMSCYDDDKKGPQQDHEHDARRRWFDRRRSEPSPEEQRPAADGPSADSGHSSLAPIEPHMGRILEIFDLFPRPIYGWWRPSTDYIRYSRYSPVHLEADSLTASDGQRWRVAFEDLLRLDHNRPMTNPTACIGRPVTEAPDDWLSKLALKGFVRDKGSYPFLLDLFGLTFFDPKFQTKTRPDETRENFVAALQAFWDLPDDATHSERMEATEFAVARARNMAETELEHYENLIRAQRRHPCKEEEAAPIGAYCPGLLALAAEENEEYYSEEEEQEDDFDDFDDDEDLDSSSYPSSTMFSRSLSVHGSAEASENDKSGQGILESLTTTERRVLPDGSVLVHTKLKKRFTDGTEWNDESTTLTEAGDVQREIPRHDRRVNAFAHPRHADEAAGKEHSPILQAVKEQQKKSEKTQKGGWFWSN